MAKHEFGHVEFLVTDLDRSRAFYEGLFGWQFRPFGGEYLLFRGPGRTAGGLMKVRQPIPGRSTIAYVEVEEIEPYLEKATALGGAIETDKSAVADMGWFALLKDPDGNVVGLWQNR